ncbi:MAG: hypothetical protein E6J34_09020 [Chloroflexi bacterium]|nr:MAG: hypothetical protein E6J34_09020 [Chloroflexota bacterium]
MEKKDLIPGEDVIHHLKSAALHPQRRGEMIARALQEVLVSLPAVGTALIWPCQDRTVPWKVYYAGARRESMRRWLTMRLDYSFDVTLSMLQQDLSKLVDMPMPHLICLQPASMSPAGLWIVWLSSAPLPQGMNDYLERVRHVLEALMEIESLEAHYFSSTSPLCDQALLEALGKGDPHALSALLSMARLMGNAEMTAWGRVYQDVIETSDHMGARQGGFGFVLQRGHGIAGRIADYRMPVMMVEDYRNSQYRDPSISHIVDSELIRSVFALPIRARERQDKSEQVVGVLYATRRNVKPFSLTECLLLQRMAYLLEPLRSLTRPPVYLSPGLPPAPDQKAAWYKLTLRANHIESLETWVSQFLKGTVVVTDSGGHPYIAARSEQLASLRAGSDSSMDGVQVISLDAPGVCEPGQVYLRSAIPLPPPEWPNFFADLILACNLILGRMEQAYDYLARQREQWLHAVLQEKALPQLRQDGYRLGLPVGEGQLWVIAWSAQSVLSRQAARKRMLVEDIVLAQLKSPLLFLGDDIGIILLGEHAQEEPAKLREALLSQFAPHPLWIVHGAYYHSLNDLKVVLMQSISQAQMARRKGNSEYLLDVQTPGLESLLANPRLTDDLHNFANRLLRPLLEYDKNKGTDLTTTFVLAQTLGSTKTVGDELGVHVNTIRYRLHKAEDILGIEAASPKERIAWGFASFIWMRFHQLEQTAPNA